MDPVFAEVIKACIEDRRLLDIVRNIFRMSDEEREAFKRKLSIYFMDKFSDEDVNAFRFFRFVLEKNNAEKVLRGVEEYERNKR